MVLIKNATEIRRYVIYALIPVFLFLGLVDQFLDRLKRLWAVETGRVENLYDFSEGITRALIVHGVSRSIIASSVLRTLTPEQDMRVFEIEDIIRAQLRVIDLIYKMVEDQKLNITIDFIMDVHEMFTTPSRYNVAYVDGG